MNGLSGLGWREIEERGWSSWSLSVSNFSAFEKKYCFGSIKSWNEAKMFEESFGRIAFEIMLQLEERGWASAVVMKWGPGWPDSIASVGWQMQSYYCAEQLSMCLANGCYKAEGAEPRMKVRAGMCVLKVPHSHTVRAYAHVQIITQLFVLNKYYNNKKTTYYQCERSLTEIRFLLLS